ncbi:MAG: hypothetical protein LBU92_00400, partial [Prevotellaceae bacterium]|nr:hypothetical protein [Prevotellaceae bacterium]
MKKLFSLLLLAGISFSLFAQGIQQPVKWTAAAQKNSENEVELQLTASIENPWIVYSVNVPEDGPMPISITLEPSSSYKISGNLVEVNQPKEKYDAMFEMNVKYFSKEIKLTQLLSIQGVAKEIKGSIEYQCCNDKECLLFNDDFSVQINSVGEQAETECCAPEIASAPNIVPQEIILPTAEKTSKSEDNSMLTFFLLALLAGFAGVLTPCVFPMLPMTISFFMRGQSRSKGVRKAVVFGLSIVFIYTAIG